MQRQSSKNQPVFVFVHGLLGFSEIGIFSQNISYFRQLKEAIIKDGIPVLFPSLPAASTVKDRAEVLASTLRETGNKSFHLIGHSMGGLDCRYLTQCLNEEDIVRSVVTVGTPHYGTPLAEKFLTLKNLNGWLARTIMEKALKDLTPEECEQFNHKVPDRTGVRYLSFAGARPVEEMPTIFRPWARWLSEMAGPNDSQVPVASAKWGEFRGIVKADHLELAGWSLAVPNKKTQRPFDHISFYKKIIQELIDTKNKKSDERQSEAHQ